MQRDDFTLRVKQILMERVGCRCSNPNCRKDTTGPRLQNNNVISLGEAAHICAASADGPRYDVNMSKEERQSVTNGIWLCSNCHSLIDGDPERYSVELLRYWKAEAEYAQIQILETQLKGSEENMDSLSYRTEADYKAVRKDLANILTAENVSKPAYVLGTVWGFDLSTPKKQMGKSAVFIISKNGARYSIECGKAADGNAIRVTNFFKKLPEYIEELKQKLDDKRNALEQLKNDQQIKNPYTEEMKKLDSEVKQLRFEIGVEN